MSYSSNLPWPSNPKNYSVKDVPQLVGKVMIVTGGTSGIGYATTLELARKGAHVYIAARSPEKAARVITEIKSEVKDAQVDFLKLDLNDLSSVLKAATEFKSKENKLDCLINNAGIFSALFELSKDGIETHFQGSLN